MAVARVINEPVSIEVSHLVCELCCRIELDNAMVYDFYSPPWLERRSASGAACPRCRRSCASQLSHVCHEVGLRHAL
jgi:hypothetical protein